MQLPAANVTPPERFILDLVAFDYLTVRQLLLLEGYASTSLTYGQELIKSLVAAKYALPLVGTAVNQPRIYTLTEKGRHYASILGMPTHKRFRPAEEAEKARSGYFIRHTVLINDVLIAARLLTQTVPGITLSRLYTERELKRKIFVTLTREQAVGRGTPRTICLEPDASVRFLIKETWEDFFHIEVYRNLPPAEWRFKQKVLGYVTTATSGQHQTLFHTESLSIAVFAQTEEMAATLREWTEEALQQQPDDGGRFFFSSLNVANASPTEMFLSPVWEQAFSDAKVPLLMLEDA
jgi:hypothetical protein